MRFGTVPKASRCKVTRADGTVEYQKGRNPFQAKRDLNESIERQAKRGDRFWEQVRRTEEFWEGWPG